MEKKGMPKKKRPLNAKPVAARSDTDKVEMFCLPKHGNMEYVPPKQKPKKREKKPQKPRPLSFRLNSSSTGSSNLPVNFSPDFERIMDQVTNQKNAIDQENPLDDDKNDGTCQPEFLSSSVKPVKSSAYEEKMDELILDEIKNLLIQTGPMLVDDIKKALLNIKQFEYVQHRGGILEFFSEGRNFHATEEYDSVFIYYLCEDYEEKKDCNDDTITETNNIESLEETFSNEMCNEIESQNDESVAACASSEPLVQPPTSLAVDLSTHNSIGDLSSAGQDVSELFGEYLHATQKLSNAQEASIPLIPKASFAESPFSESNCLDVSVAENSTVPSSFCSNHSDKGAVSSLTEPSTYVQRDTVLVSTEPRPFTKSQEEIQDMKPLQVSDVPSEFNDDSVDLVSFDYKSIHKESEAYALAPSKSCCEANEPHIITIYNKTDEYCLSSSSSCSSLYYESADEEADIIRHTSKMSLQSNGSPVDLKNNNFQEVLEGVFTSSKIENRIESSENESLHEKQTEVADQDVQTVVDVCHTGIQCNLDEDISLQDVYDYTELCLKQEIFNRNLAITELQETLAQKSMEHQQEVAKLYKLLRSRIAEPNIEPKPLTHMARPPPKKILTVPSQQNSSTANEYAVFVPPEMFERKKEIPRKKNAKMEVTKTEVDLSDFYQMESLMKAENGFISDEESDSAQMETEDVLKKEEENAAEIVSMVKKCLKNESNEKIKSCYENFRENQCGLTGMKKSDIVAGILAQMQLEE